VESRQRDVLPGTSLSLGEDRGREIRRVAITLVESVRRLAEARGEETLGFI
jgi:hypothetical protein